MEPKIPKAFKKGLCNPKYIKLRILNSRLLSYLKYLQFETIVSIGYNGTFRKTCGVQEEIVLKERHVLKEDADNMVKWIIRLILARNKMDYIKSMFNYI